MAITVIDKLQRGGTGTGSFAVIWEADSKLSYVTVADTAARDAIEEWRRMAFMRVHVISENKDYRLGANITIAGQVWSEVSGGVDTTTYQAKSEKNQPSGYVGLEDNGKINPVYIDNIYTNNSHVTTSLSARNALSTLTGDIITTTDTSQIWVKLNNNLPPNTDDDFAELMFPGSVVSVNGQTGAVSITIASLLSDSTNLTNFNSAVAAAPAVGGLNSQVVINTTAIAALQAAVTDLEDNNAVSITTWTEGIPYEEGNYVDATDSSGNLRLFKALTNNVDLDPLTTPEGTWKEANVNDSNYWKTNQDFTVTGFRTIYIEESLSINSSGTGNFLVTLDNGNIAFSSKYLVLKGLTSSSLQAGSSGSGDVSVNLDAASLSITVTLLSGGVFKYNADHSGGFSNPRAIPDVGWVQAQGALDRTYSDTYLITKSLPEAPGSSQNGQALRWNNTLQAWEFFTPASSTLVTGNEFEIPVSNATGDGLTYSTNFKFDTTNNRLIVGTGTISAGSYNTNFGLGTTLSGSWALTVAEASVVRGNNSLSSGWSHEIGSGTGFSGNGGFTFGTDHKNFGLNTYIGGVGGKIEYMGNTRRGGFVHAFQAGSADGKKPTTVPYLLANDGAGNISRNTSAQTDGHGSLGLDSFILGGINHNIPADSPRSVIIGGNAIKARAADPDNVYVPYLNITQITQDDTLTQVLVRHSTTGKLYYKESSSFGGGGWELTGTTAVTDPAINGNVAFYGGLFTVGNSTPYFPGAEDRMLIKGIGTGVGKTLSIINNSNVEIFKVLDGGQVFLPYFVTAITPNRGIKIGTEISNAFETAFEISNSGSFSANFSIQRMMNITVSAANQTGTAGWIGLQLVENGVSASTGDKWFISCRPNTGSPSFYTTNAGLTYSVNMEVSNTGAYYMGPKDQDGSWRFLSTGLGADMLIQVRKTGTWVTRSTITYA
jgi:hypothetical protein